MMQLIPEIVAFAPEMASVRQDIHAHPEIGFEETRTAALVAEALSAWGVEVHTGIGGTGVVGVIRGNRPGRRIGLRADMDALPMHETTGLAYASSNPGVFHGCGHDGHTTMLLAAARYLAGSRRFAGEVVLIFQPAEEGLGGAVAMLRDGLFERFPCDEIYGLHNWPNAPLGQISLKRGVAMAASDNFDIVVRGKGAHGAEPQNSADPIMAATAIAQALQTIVSRNVGPLRAATVSITQFHSGSAYNVIPESAHLAGTIRTFDPVVRELIADRMRQIAASVADGYGTTAEVTIRQMFQVLNNSDIQADAAMEVANALVGPELAKFDTEPKGGSEDFADMLQCIPGAYLFVGQGPGPSLHNPRYDFNDAALPIGASLLARIAEARVQRIDELAQQ